MVDHSTADQEGHGSTPCAPNHFWDDNVMNMYEDT